jgi:hypothetical protein
MEVEGQASTPLEGESDRCGFSGSSPTVREDDHAKLDLGPGKLPGAGLIGASGGAKTQTAG